MTPLKRLATRYVLANPGKEYLILQPDANAEPFTVTLDAGGYGVEWFNVNSRETAKGRKLTVKDAGDASLTAPFTEPGPAVLYLKKSERKQKGD